jgi:hypothetical protein
MKKLVLFLSIIIGTSVWAQDCNTDSRQALWIETLHLTAEPDVAPRRVFYQAQKLWTTALPELGHISYWTEDNKLSSLPSIIIKSVKGSINQTIPLKKAKDANWKPQENLQGFVSELDLKEIIDKVLVDHEEAQLMIEVRVDQETLCRHSMDLSRIIDQE